MEYAVISFVLLAIFVCIACVMASSSETRDLERLRALSMLEVDVMRGIDFEHYVAALLVNEGFSNVQVTRASGDNGVDVTAAKDGNRYAIQVKRYKSTVNRRAVSDAVAGMLEYGCNASMVITNSRLSQKAMEFARLHQCVVVDRPVLTEWVMRFKGNAPITDPVAPTNVQMPFISTEAPNSSFSAPGSDEEFAGKEEGIATLSTKVPPEVIHEIKKFATSEFPGDFSMIEYSIKEGMTAYRDLQELTAPFMSKGTYEDILENAAAEFGSDYSTRLYSVREQLQAYKELDDLRAPSMPAEDFQKILSAAEEEFGSDFSTRVYAVKDQLRAHAEIEKIG
jgi:Holliday junction resolvase